MVRNKKGLSDIIITVSMILISIVAVGVISAFVIPMIKSQLAKSSACMALREHYKVRTDISTTCYNHNGEVKLLIQRGSEKEDALGFLVTIFSNTGDASAYRVLSDTAEYSKTPGLPDKSGAKVYNFSIIGNVEKVAITTILPNEETCDPIDYSGIKKC